jgi:hypothetical protein
LQIDASVRTRQPITDDVKAWVEKCPEVGKNVIVQLDSINIDLANLQLLVLSLSPELATLQTQKSGHHLNTALSIKRRLMSWHASLPPSWHPKRFSGPECISPTIHQAGLYQHYCDVYPSISIASSFNEYRMSLMKTESIILSCLGNQPPSLTNFTSQAACQNLIQQVADDICASVPFHLGDRIKPGNFGDKKVQYPHAPGEALPGEHYEIAPLMGGYQLLDPLGGLLRMQIKLRNGQRQWVGGQIMRISRIYNIGK